ncbi:hypothetical protein SAMN05444146_4130 [Flavobacterium johnsoniae]|jgi:hypothetical protein|uniref:Uncharacterized protein n=1 Tax=Flavobacterium johnsoniae TaxID=986 RepID=A0A1M7BTZ1_FLAJO|nr:hypothetical protein B0A63_20545 [Flavobacterium johnsoniae UW101]SHG91724.1 hypothetical protein SAMN05444388_10592 [Flavobacterium johnsoniae]SHL58498.1 hypothetical protein SAMN05444146_4130 [Flavobacterium johnsoniae]
MNNIEVFCYISLHHLYYSLKKASSVEKSSYKNLEFKFKTGLFIVYICRSFFNENYYEFLKL